ncbi:leucine-rich repeat extensin-like protein 3 [Fagus crenata]
MSAPPPPYLPRKFSPAPSPSKSPLSGHLPPTFLPAPSPFESPPPGGHRTTFLIVGVSIGGAFFLAVLLLGLFCLSKKKKRPFPYTVESEERQDPGEVGDPGTGLQESNTGEEGPPYQPKGPQAPTNSSSSTAKNKEKEGNQFRSSKLMHTGDRSTRDEEVLAHPNHDQYLNKKIKLFDEMATVVKGMVTGGSLGDV